MKNRLSRPVDPARDHLLGPGQAPITLLEYGSYACPHCRAANEHIRTIRTGLGDRVRYAFRHRPLTDSDIARRAAELAEQAQTPALFWKVHVMLMTRSDMLTEEDLEEAAALLDLDRRSPQEAQQAAARARARVDEDIASARDSGVRFTPAFYINGRRYDGPWDESSLSDAMLGSLGHRVRAAALSFASWAPSTGVLLLLATLFAIAIANSAAGPAFAAFWHIPFGLSFGDAVFEMSLLHWVNDALLTIFFLVVGLEIKREFTVGHLANRRSAALPIAAALGGMILPALFYLWIIPAGDWAHGWGIPMATDTAFAIALIAMMGRRVPIELRIFLTAAAIVDDIAAIVVVAIFYSGALHYDWLIAALAVTSLLAMLNRSGVYRALPYLFVGILLWACVHAGGLHATLAGVVLAAFIPTRPPPNYRTLAMQADLILADESSRSGEQLRHGPSTAALQALDAIHNRLESPADRMLRNATPRSSLLVLPVFALANAGVPVSADVLHGHGTLVLAIMAGLVLGKPLGFLLAAALAVRLGIAEKPAAYSWWQLLGAGALGGIGFTMSLFIAGQAFPSATDFAAAKLAVFMASLLAAGLGLALLWRAQPPRQRDEDTTTSSTVPDAAQPAARQRSACETVAAAS